MIRFWLIELQKSVFWKLKMVLPLNKMNILTHIFPRMYCWKYVANGKAVDPDLLPNKILKMSSLHLILLKLMNMCFQLSMVPGSWQQAIIAPIPKSSTKDPYMPLNYRGISLLSCIYKMYSSLINNRVSRYCESDGFIVDEQNGFRPGRSCIDQVYSMTAVLRNRIYDKLSTYCAFIDMKKASYWVNIDLLMYKLLANSDYKGSRTKLLSQSTVPHRLASVLITVAQIGLILLRESNRTTHSYQLYLLCFLMI